MADAKLDQHDALVSPFLAPLRPKGILRRGAITGEAARRLPKVCNSVVTGFRHHDGLVGIAFYLLAYAAGIAAHEGGHLLAAQLLGLRPRMIVISRGPTLLRKRIGRVWLILRAVPLVRRRPAGLGRSPGRARPFPRSR